MKKLIACFKSALYKEKIKPEIKRFLAVTIFTIIYGFGVKWFLEGAAISLYTGGIPGIAQLIRDLFVHRLGIMNQASSELFVSTFIILANVPILIIGWVGVSKRFTIYSLISVLIQATIIGFIPHLDLGLSGKENLLAATILGGLLVGVGAGGALKYGTSTGGLDILAQYYSFRKGQTVGTISFTLNAVIAISGGLIMNGITVNGITYAGGVVISYTVLRIIISTIVTDKLHTSYLQLSVDIITDKPQAFIDEILTKLYRGVTIVDVKGGYSKNNKTMIMVIISAYEFDQLAGIIHLIDEKAFVVAKPVNKVIGNFKRKTIA